MLSQGGWIQIVNTGLCACTFSKHCGFDCSVRPFNNILIIFVSKKEICLFTTSLFVNLKLQVELTVFNCSFKMSAVPTSKIIRQSHTYHNYRVVYHSVVLKLWLIVLKGPGQLLSVTHNWHPVLMAIYRMAKSLCYCRRRFQSNRDQTGHQNYSK